MGGQQSDQSQASAISNTSAIKGDAAWSSVPIRADKVLPYIYIGNYSSACSQEFLQENGISCIVNVTQEPHDEPFPNVKYLHLAAHDFSTVDLSVHFDAVHKFLTEVRLAGGIALVHCHMGVSRSVSVVMAHLLLAGRIYNGGNDEDTAASGVGDDGQKDEASASAEPAPVSMPTSPETAVTQSEAGGAQATGFSPPGAQVSLKDVWTFVKSKRSCAHPNPGFFESLQKLEMRITGTSSPSLSREDMLDTVYSNVKLEQVWEQFGS